MVRIIKKIIMFSRRWDVGVDTPVDPMFAILMVTMECSPNTKIILF